MRKQLSKLQIAIVQKKFIATLYFIFKFQFARQIFDQGSKVMF